MNNIENTPRREDEIPSSPQSGNRNSSQQGQQNSKNQGQKISSMVKALLIRRNKETTRTQHNKPTKAALIEGRNDRNMM